MSYKVKFMQNVLCEMSTCLDEGQMDMLKAVLVNHLHDVVLERDVFELSCEMDDNAVYLKLFIASRRIEGMSEATLRSYYFYTKKFLDSINKNFRDINAIDIQYYLSEYEAIHKVSRRSLDNIRKGINGVFLWLEEQEYIEKNPFRKIRPIAYEQKPIQVLSELDIVRIRDWCHGKPRDMAMIEFLLSTGVRVSELCRVNISDVNLDSGEVTIQCAKKRMKKTRTCFLTMDAVYYIKAYLQWRNDKRYTSSEALFQSNRTCGMRVTERIVNNFLRSMEKSLDLSLPLTVHVFRKTLASRLFSRGMDGKLIATLLGHASSSTSERYYIGVQTANLKHEFEKYS